MLEVLLFSFALANRLKWLKDENVAKQQELILQYAENIELQGKVNRELEDKVAERTAELMEEKKQVELQKEAIEIEKKRSDELLLNILPEKVAEELKSKGSAESKLIDNATVIFTDFKDFTKISEKYNAEQLVSEIHECFSAFDKIMEKYGVEKIKTIGDSYMAAGGLPMPNQTHPEDVVRAGLAIKKFMDEHNQRKKEEGKIFFEIRIGIHTGPVVAGIVGVKKYAYDIWGDTVNTASRLESSGEAGKVNISEDTYLLVKHLFKCVARGNVAAKGKGEIAMYYVESEL
jgi:class 3 adenylate cyclase